MQVSGLRPFRVALPVLLLVLGGAVAAAPPAPNDDEKRMTLEGQITEVMEINPPRLSVEVKGKTSKVQLLENTKVSRKGKKVDFGALKPKQCVRIKGGKPADGGGIDLNASEIEILECEKGTAKRGR